MRWLLGILGLVSGWTTLAASADVQQSTYHVTVASPGSTTVSGDQINPGPLSGVLPQMNELQQWILCGFALLITCLVGLLIKLWWNRHQQIKEQS
ncbi:cell surface protein [Lactiplantibacillus mudanjiangensis]|uniref:Cell surface protein [Lactobacillus paraplantarum] n=1 Tax=Lactiplantibacillus mudanjiangensis TaxID=1296538 RepID=A0A660DZN2_9LACO|nr:cell surface protein [Lactiplantibacillus mudanjiangensis]VDG21279.1 cell surface protein [Lactobacillus paraplantarum] [Lactiplantibacillus mudanjiangensis]VDG22461.1 cell surface protein [Lactobacillus paraplantarum] [Lactiplantibacillus mudanjiangensis]VDG27006.1 cell surface protein [Lactobacillus paraplantarum] [Lactiplantibacillus mudanjiangensis]VDG32106.1 cell surface protein [Lactobacillus paraplantarum] [Lactiplantibacillus mudanjiangensis]